MNDLYAFMEKKFLEGRFAEINERLLQDKALQLNPKIIPYWVGSLALSGQLDKALIVFSKSSLPSLESVACRFYLAVASIRQSQYQQGRELIMQNLKVLRKKTSALQRFYIYQGIAFYRFFCGRFSRSQFYAHSSFRAAIEANFTLGEILSRDLLAHSLVQTGEVRLGLKYFEEAMQIAQKVKNQWMAPALQIAILKFKAQMGDDAAQDPIHLQEALENIKTHDVYSQGELMLEMARQHILRGQFTKAEDLLSVASEVIYKNQNRRQMALLNIRMSYMLFLQGQNSQALHVLRFAEQNLDEKIDLNLWMQMSGLKLKIYEALQRFPEVQELQKNLINKTKLSQTAIHQKIIARSQQKKHSFPKGEDPIGDLLDKIANQDIDAPSAIFKSGYYGLLHKCYQLPFETQCLIFDLLPSSLILLNQGNVSLKRKGVNSLLRKIILSLKEKPMSKEALVEEIWGYQYEPLRHDPLIYSAMNKVRKLLAPHGDWIVLTEQGYQLKKDVSLIVKNSLQKTAEKTLPSANSKSKKIKIPKNASKKWKDLNFRQLQVLEYLKQSSSISILELSTRLEISKPTATRDLSKLYNLGILKRIGKGRATRYFT